MDLSESSFDKGEREHLDRRTETSANLWRIAEEVVEAELRQAPLERHLAALEALEVHVAAAGLLALAAAARGLAEAGPLAAADALALAVRALGRLELAE